MSHSPPGEPQAIRSTYVLYNHEPPALIVGPQHNGLIITRHPAHLAVALYDQHGTITQSWRWTEQEYRQFLEAAKMLVDGASPLADPTVLCLHCQHTRSQHPPSTHCGHTYCSCQGFSPSQFRWKVDTQ